MKNLLIILLLISLCPLLAIFDDYEPSPRARALGGAYYAASTNPDAVFYNPAGLSLASGGVEMGYYKLFGENFAKVSTVAISFPLAGIKKESKYGVIGIGMQSMDVDYYDVSLTTEKQYSLAYGVNIMKDAHSELNFGATATMYHLSFNGLGSQRALGINVGVLAVLHARTKIAFTVTNINNPKMGHDNAFSLPQKLVAGINYNPYDGVSTIFELQKSFGDYSDTEMNNTEIHAGTEISLIKIMSTDTDKPHKISEFLLRFGVRNNPFTYSMGAEIGVHGICVNYAYAMHAVLDDTHHFTVGYKF